MRDVGPAKIVNGREGHQYGYLLRRVSLAQRTTRTSKQTWSAYAEPISIESAMLPLMANEMAFMNLPRQLDP